MTAGDADVMISVRSGRTHPRDCAGRGGPLPQTNKGGCAVAAKKKAAKKKAAKKRKVAKKARKTKKARKR